MRKMIYFEDPSTPGDGPNGGDVRGFDKNDPNDAPYITKAQADKWPDITSKWPQTPTLADIQTIQIGALQNAYQQSLAKPITFMNAAGVKSTYAFGNALTPGGLNAQQLLTEIVSAGAKAWKAGVWIDMNGVAQIMTFADLQGLMAAIEAADTPDEQDLMAKIAAVQAITTSNPAKPSATAIKAIQAITF